MKTMCIDIGATGSSFCSRSLRTLMRFIRLLMSFLMFSRPMSPSSSAISSSRSGFFSGSSGLTGVSVLPPEVWVRGGCFSEKLGSPLVTKSSGLSASLLLRTPLVSQMAVSLSVHSVIYSASA